MRRFVALSTVLYVMFVGLARFPGPVSASAPPPAAVQRISWGACSDAALIAAHAQCGFLSVPLDYAHPNGANIRLAVAGCSTRRPHRNTKG